MNFGYSKANTWFETDIFTEHFQYTTCFSGVGHSEDLGYIFDFGRNGTETDCLVRDRFIRLLTNFVKYRNPTPQNDKLLQNIHWPANNCTSGSECDIKQLDIRENLTVVNNPYKDNANFWKVLFEKNGGSPFDTY